jgi:hypothetical protein
MAYPELPGPMPAMPKRRIQRRGRYNRPIVSSRGSATLGGISIVTLTHGGGSRNTAYDRVVPHFEFFCS